MQSKSWYRSWFDSPYYQLLYKGRDQNEAAFFIDRLMTYLNPSPDSKFLDLACGRGRHSIQIHNQGYYVEGIDLSVSSIQDAQKHETDGLKFFVHDMREFYKKETFDFVVNLFTSFGYFDSIEQNQNVLQSAYTALKSKGTLIIDFLNPNTVRNNIVENESLSIEGIEFSIRRSYEEGWIKKQIEITDNGKVQQFEERVWAIEHEDFKTMLDSVGFTLINTFGSYNMDEYKPRESDRQILIASKP